MALTNNAPFTPPSAPIAEGPFVHGQPIVPSDTVLLPHLTRGIYVGGDGDVTLLLAGDKGGSITFTAVVAGTTLNVCAQQVFASTTATLLVALW